MTTQPITHYHTGTGLLYCSGRAIWYALTSVNAGGVTCKRCLKRMAARPREAAEVATRQGVAE